MLIFTPITRTCSCITSPSSDCGGRFWSLDDFINRIQEYVFSLKDVWIERCWNRNRLFLSKEVGINSTRAIIRKIISAQRVFFEDIFSDALVITWLEFFTWTDEIDLQRWKSIYNIPWKGAKLFFCFLDPSHEYKNCASYTKVETPFNIILPSRTFSLKSNEKSWWWPFLTRLIRYSWKDRKNHQPAGFWIFFLSQLLSVF